MIFRNFTITLVRHGETLSNREKIMQGQKDTQLSDLGLAQAKLVGERLLNEQFTHMFASDLARAADTARAIVQANTKTSCQLTLKRELRERCFGWLEGKPLSDFHQVIKELNIAPQKYTPEGGETLDQVTERAHDFFLHLCQLIISPFLCVKCHDTPTSLDQVASTSELDSVSVDMSQPNGSDGVCSCKPSPTGLGRLGSNGQALKDNNMDAACENKVQSGGCTEEDGPPRDLWEAPDPTYEPEEIMSLSVEEASTSSQVSPTKEDHVLVVSHGLWLREFKSIILSHYKGEKLQGDLKREATRISPNTGVCKFNMMVTFTQKKLLVKCMDVLSLNDTSHLQTAGNDLVTHAKFEGSL